MLASDDDDGGSVGGRDEGARVRWNFSHLSEAGSDRQRRKRGD